MKTNRILSDLETQQIITRLILAMGFILWMSLPRVMAESKFFVPPAGAAGDYDESGEVDPGDLSVWQTSYGVDAGADGDGDDDSDGADFLIWQRNLGKSAAAVGDWENADFWAPAGLPGQFDGALIHANRTANISTDVGAISELRIGDTFDPPGGTLNINSGGKLTTLGQVLMGASNPGEYKEGQLNLNGGTLETFGAFFLAFEPGATETLNVGPDSLLDVNQNMFGRFGTATVNQTGGIVDVQNNLIWGEGGDDDGLGQVFSTRSEYNLMAGELKIGQTLAIGGEIGSPRPKSNGRVNVSGGTLTASDLVFDSFPGEEAILSISGTGIVRIDQANYSTADANSDIASGLILGDMLDVSTVSDGGTDYTQIVSVLATDVALGVPEPGAHLLLIAGLVSVLASTRKQFQDS